MDCYFSLSYRSYLSMMVLSGVLESQPLSSYLLLSHPTVALAYHIAIILISTLQSLSFPPSLLLSISLYPYIPISLHSTYIECCVCSQQRGALPI